MAGRGCLEVRWQVVLFASSPCAPPPTLGRRSAGHAPHPFGRPAELPRRRAYTRRAGERGSRCWLETPRKRGPEASPGSGPGASRARRALGGGRSVGLFLQPGECGTEGGGSPGRRRPEADRSALLGQELGWRGVTRPHSGASLIQTPVPRRAPEEVPQHKPFLPKCSPRPQPR